VSDTHTSGRRGRAWRLLGALLALGLVAAACGDDSGGGDESGEGTDETITNETIEADTDEVATGGELVVGLEAETNSWLPGTGSFASPGTNVARALYDSIAARGSDGQVYPLLAESITSNEDLTEWTVTLRPDITFHDGTPLDAATVKANFDEYLNIPTSTQSANLAQVTEFRVDDELTYTYVLSGPNVAFPDLLTGSIGYPFSIEACRAAGDACGENPVGAGPFKFVSWVRDSEIVLERYEDYWRTDANGVQLPYLDRLIFRPIPDENSRVQAVLARDAHAGQTLRQATVRTVRDNVESGDLETYEFIGNNGGGAIYNTFMPPVDDQRVRLGLAHAVQQDVLVEILGGEGITPPQTQYFSESSPWYSQAVADAWPKYDPERAQELLGEYVNDPARSDGKAPGEPISIEFNCPPDPTLIQVSQGYQQMLDAVGVEVNLNQVEQASHITNALGADSNPPFSGDFMVNCWRMGAQQDPYITLSQAFGDPATNAQNFTNYSSATVDENLEILGTTTDIDERYAAVEAIMMEFTEQVPNLWTGGTATALFAQPTVRNLAGWTIPVGEEEVPGEGAAEAQTYWAQVWMEQ
jgi:peptide/nickel transport system substrate-binding protein